MKKFSLKLVAVAILLNTSSVLFAKKEDTGSLPVISLGVVEEVVNKKNPKYVNYLVLICATENQSWKFNSFDVSHSLKGPKLLASQVFSSGTRDGVAITQFIRISEDFLDVGDVNVRAIFHSRTGKGHKGASIDLSDFIRNGKYEQHKIEESALIETDVCSLAEPLSDDDVKVSFGAKIH